MKPGKQLERLIATLEQVLAGDKSVQVISPYKAKDRTNNRLREHDVVLVFTHGHHKVVTAVECRDRSRPVGVNQVEGFYQKCLDTGIHRAVIVSPKGFFKSALVKAGHLKVECLRLDQIDAFDWIGDGYLDFCQIRFENVCCNAIPEKDFESKLINYKLFDASGVEISEEVLNRNIQAGVNKVMEGGRLEAGSHSISFSIQTPGCLIKDLESGQIRSMKLIGVSLVLVVEHANVPLSKVEYRNGESDALIGQMAVATLASPLFSADLVFKRNADDSTSVILVPKRL